MRFGGRLWSRRASVEASAGVGCRGDRRAAMRRASGWRAFGRLSGLFLAV